MFKLVTAINESYYPALVALHNSFKANAGPGIDFVCFVHGNQSLVDKVAARGIMVIHNPELHADLPTTSSWPVPEPAMYSRLLIPHIFPGEKAAWIDADCVILKPLAGLLEIEFPNPVAAVKTSTVTLGQQVGGLPPHDQGTPALFAGLLVFNTAVWNRERVTERCRVIMNDPGDLDFFYVVQSVLSLVLRGDFHVLPYIWQEFANRGALSAQCRIGHWVGCTPWLDECENLDTWRLYAE